MTEKDISSSSIIGRNEPLGERYKIWTGLECYNVGVWSVPSRISIWPQYTLVVANYRADIVLYAITIKYHSYIPDTTQLQCSFIYELGLGLGLDSRKIRPEVFLQSISNLQTKRVGNPLVLVKLCPSLR